MANTILKGDELMLFKGSTTLGYATANTITINGSEINVGSKDHGFWGATEIGELNWEITSDNLYTSADYDTLFTAMVTKDPITVSFSIVSNYAPAGLQGVGQGDVAAWTKGAGYTGQAFITSLVANANHGENATYSVTLKGNGAIVKES